ncbi:MAG: hypothetical protein O3A46_05865, partial [Candidatus Poribacteria bacterium]|nr:hypothetical protein [Candidatus Poribacteria bacterium]
MAFRPRRLWATLIVWTCLSAAAVAQNPPIIIDHQTLDIDEPQEDQVVGPISILGLPVPRGFDVDFTLTISHRATVKVGDRTLTFNGNGGTLSNKQFVFLQKGITYPVVETYQFNAKVDSAFIAGEFSLPKTVNWTLTPAVSGRYEFAVVGAARNLSLQLLGDIEGDAQLGVVGNELKISIETTRTIPANTFLTYRGIIKAVLDRTASVQFDSAILPQWDVTKDGRTDLLDIVTVARQFGQVGAGLVGDVDGNGFVNFVDLVTVATHYGETFALAAPMRAVVDASVIDARLTQRELPDGTTLVELVAERGVDIGGFDIELAFDPAMWEPIEAEVGARIGSPWTLPVAEHEGSARLIAVSLVGESRETTDGAVATFRFRRLAENAGAISLRRIDLADTQAQALRARLLTGMFQPSALPSMTRVGQNFPNPFNPETWIPFSLSDAADVRVEIYAADGHRVRTLELGALSAGSYVGRDQAADW